MSDFHEGPGPRGPLQPAPGAVGSMVCGILSIVLALPVVGLVLGIIALVLASKAKGHAQREPARYTQGGMRTAGLVCGIIGTVIGAFVIFAWAIGIAWFASPEGKRKLDDLRQRIEQEQERQRQDR